MEATVTRIKVEDDSSMRVWRKVETAHLSTGQRIFRRIFPQDPTGASDQSWMGLFHEDDIPSNVKPKLRGGLAVGQVIRINNK